MSRAMYAFSGDPITYGHIDIIKRAAAVFDHVVVGIGVNPQKNYLFTLEERTEMAQWSLRGIANIEVCAFSGLLVDYAYEKNASVIVKGVRNPEDFSYENVLHQVGESQKLGIDTHILFARPELAHVSSGAVKDIQKNQGVIHHYVPLLVKQKLESKISGQCIVGVTGEMGSGKTYISRMLQDGGSDIPIHNIELDHIGHQILGELTEPAYVHVREEIASIFGSDLIAPDGFIDRKALGEIVFNDRDQLQVLNKMLYTPISVRLRRELLGKQGIVLVNAALLAETDMLHICNNNVILLEVDKATQTQRLKQRELTFDQIQTRVGCQYDTVEKRAQISKIIKRDHYGHIWDLDNSNNCTPSRVRQLLSEVKEYFGI
ncbi:MAG: pantetheine-phosphate adenylyltransferase [Phycisphaerae bacterium]|nr:pantetheine-phosphate adenylyltransferase [Phycisphaerae bacterium]